MPQPCKLINAWGGLAAVGCLLSFFGATGLVNTCDGAHGPREGVVGPTGSEDSSFESFRTGPNLAQPVISGHLHGIDTWDRASLAHVPKSKRQRGVEEATSVN